MSIASAFGFGGKKVRYAVVGLGDITQEAFLPGVSHTGNSEVVALVTGDPEKARKVGDRYDVTEACDYDGFADLLASGKIDAVYIGTPNWRHAEFVIPALEAGIHVLCEKPLEISSEKCRAIIEAQQRSSARLMVAYRLHFEPATLDAIDRIRKGELGELIAFTSCFAQMLDPANHRADHGIEAGPLFDMGPYQINAARYLFGAEPTEVISATAIRHEQAGLGELDDTMAVTLRFPGDALAQFSVSYFANGINNLTIAGTKGSITMDPAYTYGEPLQQHRKVGGKHDHQSFKATDQFGGELKYFSDCILEGRDPEPDGEEGLADLLVIEAIRRSLDSGRPEKIEPLQRTRRIDPASQLQSLGGVSAPEPIKASDPVQD